MNKVLHVFRKDLEVGKNVCTALNDFLDGLFLRTFNLPVRLDLCTGKSARNVYITIAKQAFRDEGGCRVGKNVLLAGSLDAHNHFDAAVLVLQLARSARSDRDLLNVADL